MSQLNVTTDYGYITQMKITETFISLDSEINQFKSLVSSNNNASLIKLWIFLYSDSNI